MSELIILLVVYLWSPLQLSSLIKFWNLNLNENKVDYPPLYSFNPTISRIFIRFTECIGFDEWFTGIFNKNQVVAFIFIIFYMLNNIIPAQNYTIP